MRRHSERAYYVARRFVRRFGANAANERYAFTGEWLQLVRLRKTKG